MHHLNGLKFIRASALTLITIGVTVSADINVDGQVIPAADISSIVILPASGDLNVITIPGYTVTRNGTTPPTPGSVAISGFSASPSSITEGQTTTISWTTANAAACTPTGGAGGWSGLTVGPASGSTGITIATAGTYKFTLSCAGATSGDTAVRQVTVTVNKPPPPPAAGSCETPSLPGTTGKWFNFWGIAFPGPGYANKLTTMRNTNYQAFEFNTGNIVDNGLMVTVSNTITSGVRLGAISECPGDFDVAPECDHLWGIGGGITWATNGKSGACQLLPDTTYYFNVTFTDGVDPASSSCATTNCTTKLQHVNR